MCFLLCSCSLNLVQLRCLLLANIHFLTLIACICLHEWQFFCLFIECQHENGVLRMNVHSAMWPLFCALNLLCSESFVHWILCAFVAAPVKPGAAMVELAKVLETDKCSGAWWLKGSSFFRGSRALAWTIIKCGWLCWSFLMLVCLIPPMVYYSC